MRSVDKIYISNKERSDQVQKRTNNNQMGIFDKIDNFCLCLR